MSTGYYDPAEHAKHANSIVMTPSAQTHVRRQLALQGASALQLGIKSSGCNGYMYDLSYLDQAVRDAAADSRVFDFDGITVLVANANWPMLRGTEIDFVTEGLNSMLVFKNPNATAECGCGESFSVEEAAAS